ncbi:MAG: hypothetical protein C0473_03525 [Cyanobacteria bacterium DS3.002]|nr:hypothetical protein [Cyanobacteria bacterium DS3.002]
MKLFPVLFNLSFKVSLSLGLALSLSLSSPTLAQSDNGDLKSESESQATSSDDSMNTLWAESQESQKPTDSAKKTKPKSKSKTKKSDAPLDTKSDSTSSTPIDLSPSSSKEPNAETKVTTTPTVVPEAKQDADLSTPIMIQPAPAAMGETTVTDVSGLCSLSAFQNSDLLRTAAWPGVGPFTAESDNKFVDPQDNKLKLHVDGDHVTACELLLNNQNGSKQSILNLEMTCDFMLEALGAKGNKISEFNTYFEKNKDKIATSKANSENQVKTTSGSYVIALAGGGQSASNSVLIQVTSKNKVLTDEQSLASSISPAKTEPVDETPTVASTATTARTSTAPIKSTPTKGITAKAGVTKTSTIKPATTVASSKPAAKPTKVETTETTPEAVKTEPQPAATKDPLRDELAGAIRSWQTIKKSALKDRNPAGLSKILSGTLLQRQTDSIKALTDSKHYYELTPKGVVVEKYTELSSSPQKYSVYAKVMELTKIMKDGATKPEKETDDTYSVNYTVERSGDHWTISNSLLLVKKK